MLTGLRFDKRARLSRLPRSERGFSMLETLVTLLIIAIWLLGSAGVQTIAMKLNKSSAMRNQAILLVAEVGERMENNRSASSDGKSYVLKKKEPRSKSNCTSQACSPDALAKHDLAEVYHRANDIGFDIEILRTAGGGINDQTVTYSIQVTWTDRKTSQTYADGADETATYLGSKTIFRTAEARA